MRWGNVSSTDFCIFSAFFMLLAVLMAMDMGVKMFLILIIRKMDSKVYNELRKIIKHAEHRRTRQYSLAPIIAHQPDSGDPPDVQKT